MKLTSKNSIYKIAFISPALLWLIVFFTIPIGIIIIYSFSERGIYGGIEYQFTIENYSILLEPIYISALGRTLLLSSTTSLICLILGYPIAYYISKQINSSRKRILLFLIIIPFWTNFLIRIFSWMIILGNEGLLNTMLFKLGLISEPVEFLFTPFAVQLGLVYNYLPLMILPIYASLEQINQEYLLAARDLGASKVGAFFRITIPLSTSGVIAGVLLVFIPCFGEFVTPDLLGGAKTSLIGNVIRDQFLSARNWPLGSAASLIVISIAAIMLFILHNTGKYEN